MQDLSEIAYAVPLRKSQLLLATCEDFIEKRLHERAKESDNQGRRSSCASNVTRLRRIRSKKDPQSYDHFTAKERKPVIGQPAAAVSC